MTYTFLSAIYSNPDHTAARAMTVEAAEIAVSEVDTPALWADLHVAGAVAPFIAPAPLPRTMSPAEWCAHADSEGKASAWLAAINAVAAKPKDRLYAITGGETGQYQEGNSKLGRLAAAAGIVVSTAFDAQ